MAEVSPGGSETWDNLPVRTKADPSLGDQKFLLPDDVNIIEHPFRMCISGKSYIY
jgi:hypothetical protein